MKTTARIIGSSIVFDRNFSLKSLWIISLLLFLSFGIVLWFTSKELDSNFDWHRISTIHSLVASIGESIHLDTRKGKKLKIINQHQIEFFFFVLTLTDWSHSMLVKKHDLDLDRCFRSSNFEMAFDDRSKMNFLHSYSERIAWKFSQSIIITNNLLSTAIAIHQSNRINQTLCLSLN